MQVHLSNTYTVNDAIFLVIEQLIAFVCIFIPFILFWTDGQLRGSISAYVDMDRSHIFGLLLGISATLFILNGALYFSTGYVASNKKYKKQYGRWYNIILGFSLIGVVIFPYNGPNAIVHYVFALLFFAGSAVVIFFIHEPQHRLLSKLIAIAAISSLLTCVLTDEQAISLFWAESISLFVVGIHYILQSKSILTIVRSPKKN